MPNRSLITMVHGSRLYGTATPESDLDLKAVHLPDGGDILLQCVLDVDQAGSTNRTHLPNTSADVDIESYSAQFFLSMVARNKVDAIEMLFAPEQAWESDPEAEWLEIVDNRDRLLCRDITTFADYARGQAARYAIRGERVAAVRRVVEALRRHSPSSRLETAIDDLREIAETAGNTPDGVPLVTLVDHVVRGTNGIVKHVVVCGKMAPLTVTIERALGTFERQLQNYGSRSLNAEKAGAADWKAMSHALRIAGQAVEFLTTGHISLPRPDAEYLVAVKRGRVPLMEVSAGIERSVAAITTAGAMSVLPEQPDHAWIQDFIVRHYGDAVMTWRNALTSRQAFDGLQNEGSVWHEECRRP